MYYNIVNMDSLIDNAIYGQSNDEMDALNKCIVKNRTLMKPYIGYCWDYEAQWSDSILEKVYTFYKSKPKKSMKLIQSCTNKRCLNPEHMVEVDYDTWFTKGLNAKEMWMDIV